MPHPSLIDFYLEIPWLGGDKWHNKYASYVVFGLSNTTFATTNTENSQFTDGTNRNLQALFQDEIHYGIFAH